MGRSGIEKNVIYAIIPNPNPPPKRVFLSTGKALQEGRFCQSWKNGFSVRFSRGESCSPRICRFNVKPFCSSTNGSRVTALAKGPKPGGRWRLTFSKINTDQTAAHFRVKITQLHAESLALSESRHFWQHLQISPRALLRQNLAPHFVLTCADVCGLLSSFIPASFTSNASLEPKWQAISAPEKRWHRITLSAWPFSWGKRWRYFPTFGDLLLTADRLGTLGNPDLGTKTLEIPSFSISCQILAYFWREMMSSAVTSQPLKIISFFWLQQLTYLPVDFCDFFRARIRKNHLAARKKPQNFTVT